MPFWCEHLDQEQDFWNTCYPEVVVVVEEEATKIFYVDHVFAHKLLVLDLSSLLCLDYASWGLGSFGEWILLCLHVGAPLKRMIMELVCSVELLDGYSDQRDWRENIYQGRQQLWTSCKHGQQPLSTIHLLLQWKKLV
jgi:hypothetical protein